MSLRRSMVVTVVLLALFSFACGGDPPEKEIQQAKAAIDAARSAGADLYAAEEYTAAVEALKNANIAVEQRDYRLALNDALDSKERADNAARLAVEGKAAARAAAGRAITAATAATAAADAKLKVAGGSRQPPHAVVEARAAMDEAQKHVQEARTAFEGGNYFEAIRAASAAGESIKAVNEKLESAPAAQPRRRPGTH